MHNAPYEKIVRSIKAINPDIIAVAGDFVGRYYLEFFGEITKVAPVFAALGNHDYKYNAALLNKKAVILDNRHCIYNGIYIGGLSTRYDLKWLDLFSKQKGYKILICHHPEYYKKYIKRKNINLVLSGHAHGGQIRILGQGIYSPGQGLFPKLTGGVYDNRLIVSRGLANTAPFPRIFNKAEVVSIIFKKAMC